MSRAHRGSRLPGAVVDVATVRGVALAAIGLAGLAIARPVLAQAEAATGVAGAADADSADPLDAAAWLAGCWEAASPDGLNAAEEQWMVPRGGLMVGMSRSIRGGSAQGYELATIRPDDTGRLVYHAMPSGQVPTDFPARAIDDGRLEFVNADHDFPQKIVYARLDPDLVHAAVFGEADGAEPSFLIPYRRVACPGS